MAEYGFLNNSETIELYHSSTLLFSTTNTADNGDTYMVKHTSTSDLEFYVKGDLLMSVIDE